MFVMNDGLDCTIETQLIAKSQHVSNFSVNSITIVLNVGIIVVCTILSG